MELKQFLNFIFVVVIAATLTTIFLGNEIQFFVEPAILTTVTIITLIVQTQRRPTPQNLGECFICMETKPLR